MWKLHGTTASTKQTPFTIKLRAKRQKPFRKGVQQVTKSNNTELIMVDCIKSDHFLIVTQQLPYGLTTSGKRRETP